MRESDEEKAEARSAVAIIKQLMADNKAFVPEMPDPWVLIPHAHFSQDLRKHLDGAGIPFHHHPTVIAIDAGNLNTTMDQFIPRHNGIGRHTREQIKERYAAKRLSKEKKMSWSSSIEEMPDIKPVTRSAPASKTPWWEHKNLMELARSLPTYSEPLMPILDDYRAEALEEHANKTRSRGMEVEQYLEDPEKLIGKYDLTSEHVEKLRKVVKRIHEICKEWDIPVPKLTLDPNGSCADYQRLNIGIPELKNHSLRSIIAVEAHELAHVVLNHALIRKSDYPSHMRSHPSNLAVLRQQEIDADYLGIVMNKDPLGFVQWITEQGRQDIEKAKKPSSEWKRDTGQVVDDMNNGLPGDEHPIYRLRIHKAREMEAERARAYKTPGATPAL